MKHPFLRKTLCRFLADRDLVVGEALHELEAFDARQLLRTLYERRLIEAETLAKALSEYLQLPYCQLEQLEIDPVVADLLSRYSWEAEQAFPLTVDDNVVHVAVIDPFNVDLQLKLETRFNKTISIAVVSPESLRSAFRRAPRAVRRLENVSKEFAAQGKTAETDEESDLELSEDAAPVVRLVHSVLRAAVEKNASDIHIESQPSSTVIRYRIDGVLNQAMEPLRVEYHNPIVTRLKVMASLDITEKRTPQDGRFQFPVDDRNVDFRVSILPAALNEDVVVRILDKQALRQGDAQPRLDNLGLEPSVIDRLRRAVTEPYGMVVVTGPTGSGKTTTLYAAITELNSTEEKIITIEDPIEYRLEGIAQIAVNEKKQLTFARGLRSILRHDPDKIMVGEIRDLETAEIAVQSALTGHLVLTTIHANTAIDVVNRLQHMGVDPYVLVSSLNCVVAQRLIRRICPSCKQRDELQGEEVAFWADELPDIAQRQWYRGVGCETCNHTGYSGRTAVAEFLKMSPAIRQGLLERAPLDAIRTLAVAEGMVPLRQSALNKALAGETTLEEVNRVTAR